MKKIIANTKSNFFVFTLSTTHPCVHLISKIGTECNPSLLRVIFISCVLLISLSELPKTLKLGIKLELTKIKLSN